MGWVRRRESRGEAVSPSSGMGISVSASPHKQEILLKKSCKFAKNLLEGFGLLLVLAI